MTEVHVTEAELARDLHAVLEKVQQGAEVIVEKDQRPIAVIKLPQPLRRTISDCIAIAQQRETARGHAVTLDTDFAADVEEIVRNRQPWKPLSWD